MATRLDEAFFDFKGRTGTNNWAAQPLMYRFANSMDERYDFTPKLSHSLLKDRLQFVEQNASTYFEIIQSEKMKPEPLNNGKESLVFDCNNGYVLKIRKGEPFPTLKSNYVLQPVSSGYSQKLNVTYDIFPKVETKKIGLLAAYKMLVKSLMNGFSLLDANPDNFGLIGCSDKKEKSLVIIDAGAVKPIESIRDGYHIAKSFLSPVYARMPFIHPYWRAFRDEVKEMLGTEKKKTPIPTQFSFDK